MPDQSRALPGQPSLRYLNVEANGACPPGNSRRCMMPKLAIAREHGLPSWAALKEYIVSGTRQGGPVLAVA